MLQGKTSTGFEFEIDERRTMDMRLVDAMAAMFRDGTTPAEQCVELVNILDLLLGNDQKTKLYEHIAANNDGFVPAQAVFEEIQEIRQAKPIKN